VRILFSSTRALRERGHEILGAGPADLAETLARAQLPHAVDAAVDSLLELVRGPAS